MARVAVWLVAMIAMISGMGAGYGQDYPNKPIRIVTASPGGGTDFVARQIALGISGPLGQQVIVENRPSGVIPGETVAKSAPDGYTLLATGGILWMGPLLQKTPYDAVRDFSPISLTATSPNVVVVHPSLPVKSVKELIALAKSKPGELNYGAAGVGGSSHLSGELFNAMAGINIVRVAYKGTPVVITELIGGQIQVAFSSATSVAPHIKSNRLRALAVTSVEPSALVPGAPTVAAAGLPGYEAAGLDAIMAPAKTPAPIINRLNQEVVRTLNRPDVKEKLLTVGSESATASPEATAAKIKSEIARWGKVIKDAGIKGE